MHKKVSILHLFIVLKKLHWFVTPMDMCTMQKSNLITQTFLKLLEFQESWNLID